jgi:hypothetical protein
MNKNLDKTMILFSVLALTLNSHNLLDLLPFIESRGDEVDVTVGTGLVRLTVRLFDSLAASSCSNFFSKLSFSCFVDFFTSSDEDPGEIDGIGVTIVGNTRRSTSCMLALLTIGAGGGSGMDFDDLRSGLLERDDFEEDGDFEDDFFGVVSSFLFLGDFSSPELDFLRSKDFSLERDEDFSEFLDFSRLLDLLFSLRESRSLLSLSRLSVAAEFKLFSGGCLPELLNFGILGNILLIA